MKTQKLRRLVTTSLSIACFSVPTFYTFAATSSDCDDIVSMSRTSVSENMVALLGKDISKSNHVTTVIPVENNPFVTEALVSIANEVSPNGILPQHTPEEIMEIRTNLEQAALEAEKLQSALELTFVGLLDGYCHFSSHELVEEAKIDFDHVEGLVLYSIPTLLSMVDQSYAMATKPTEEQPSAEEVQSADPVSEEQHSDEGEIATASYQKDKVSVAVE